MAAFEYVALDQRGRERRGVLEGDTPRQLRQQLRDQGLTPVSIEPVAHKEQRRERGHFGLRRGISAADMALITRQLATLVRSALPLDEALQTVARQSDKPRIKSMLLAVRSKVVEGHTLADALGEFPHIFPDIYRTTVASGEQSSHLDLILERLADYTESRQQMRQSIQMALLYPAILTVMAILVTTALLVYVVPEVVQVFDNIGQELPPLTIALITLSEVLREYGLIMVGVGVGVLALFLRLLKRPAFLFQWHRLLLKTPLVARLVGGANTATFARTFSIMTASGVPVLEAMRISSSVLSNLPMRAAVDAAAHRVREGGGIAHALEQSGYFPPITVHLIASGEVSGNLEEMLARAAENQERELKGVIAMALGMFEPLLLVTMGGVVMVIVLAILLPIFEINQLIQ